MSAPKSTSAVVVPTEGSVPKPDQAAAVTKMAGGGLVLSPLPLGGGKRRSRKTKRLSKKVLKMFKKGSAKKLAKLMKGGEEAEAMVTGGAGEDEELEGARRKGKGRKTRRASKKTRHSFLY